MTIFHKSPLLVAGTKSGNRKYWQMFGAETEKGVVTYTEYWQVNGQGVESQNQSSADKVIVGKNSGKVNETSAIDQAVSEIDSQTRLQRDKGYVEESDFGGESTSLILPMLAHKYNERKKGLTFPVFVQPKLDGVRRLYNNFLGGWSRQGKPEIPKIAEHLKFDTFDRTFDGELMLPQETHTFQETVAAVKKYRPDVSPLLEYHIYDLVGQLSFEERQKDIEAFFQNNVLPPNVKRVPTYLASCEEAIFAYHALFIQQGYEGTIIRDGKAPYLTGHRSEFLLKYKDFLDGEFRIVNVLEGAAKETGMAIFVCETESGQEFKARPRGTNARRKAWYDNRIFLIGKNLTVRYQNLTDEGIPRFPVGIALRDYE